MYQEKILCILSIRYVKLQISETISVAWYQIYNVCNMTSLKNKQLQSSLCCLEIYFSLYNDVNATCAVIGRYSWSIGVQIHAWHHRKLVFFVLFNISCGFGLRASESLEETLQELFTKKKNGEKERKRALHNLRMPKIEEIFTTVAIVCHCYERWVRCLA